VTMTRPKLFAALRGDLNTEIEWRRRIQAVYNPAYG
jgi:hypothetical protein